MAPRPDEEPEEVDTQTQEQVRRLLAAAAGPRRPELPEEVASRLDGVLAGLVQERGTDPLGPPVDVEAGPVPPEEVVGVPELASRRRRRGPRLLVAAAAVSVLVLGVGVGLDELTGSGTATTSSESATGSAGGPAQADGRAATDSRSTEEAPSLPTDGVTGPKPAKGQAPSEVTRDVRTILVRSRSLESDLQEIENAGLAVPVEKGSSRWRDACVHPAVGPGDEWVRVRFDRRPAVLVLRAPSGDRRTAEVFRCGAAGTPAASATVEAW